MVVEVEVEEAVWMELMVWLRWLQKLHEWTEAERHNSNRTH